MGCGSSKAVDIIEARDVPELKQQMMKQALGPVSNASQAVHPYPRQPPHHSEQQLLPTHNNNLDQLHEAEKKIITKNNVNVLHRQELSEDSLSENQNYEPFVINEEHLEDYIKLEKSIHELEKKKVLQRLHIAVDELQKVSIEIAADEEIKQKITSELKSKNMGKAEIPSVTAKHLMMEIDAIDDKANKNDAKNKDKAQEIKVPSIADDSLQMKKAAIEAELVEKRNKYSELENEVNTLNTQAAELLDMYLMQDEHIVKIFGQGYANDEEARLGNRLHCLEEKKARIEKARCKWKEAQLLLEYACKQLAVAIQQWQDLPNVPSINLEVRYSLSDDATKCLTNASEKFGLGDYGKMPYCTSEELAALEAMVASNKMDNVDEKHLMLLDNSDPHKRALAMLKWFSKVFSTSIHRDLVDVSEEVRVTSQALRKERLHIIRDKLKEKRRFSIDQLSSLDNDDGDDAVRRMLSGCKDGKNCQVIHDHQKKNHQEKDVNKGNATVIQNELRKNKQENKDSGNLKASKEKEIASNSDKNKLEGDRSSGNTSSSNKQAENKQMDGKASTSNKQLEKKKLDDKASSSNKQSEKKELDDKASSSNKQSEKKELDDKASSSNKQSEKKELDDKASNSSTLKGGKHQSGKDLK